MSLLKKPLRWRINRRSIRCRLIAVTVAPPLISALSNSQDIGLIKSGLCVSLASSFGYSRSLVALFFNSVTGNRQVGALPFARIVIHHRVCRSRRFRQFLAIFSPVIVPARHLAVHQTKRWNRNRVGVKSR